MGKYAAEIIGSRVIPAFVSFSSDFSSCVERLVSLYYYFQYLHKKHIVMFIATSTMECTNLRLLAKFTIKTGLFNGVFIFVCERSKQCMRP